MPKDIRSIVNIKKPGISIYYDKSFLEIYFYGYNKNRNIFVNQNNKYIFEEIWNGVDVIYTKKRLRLEEKIIIKNHNSTHNLKFLIKTNNEIKSKNNKMHVESEKRKSINFEKLKAMDSNSKEIKDGLSLKFDSKTGILEIKVNHIDGDRYPITVQ